MVQRYFKPKLNLAQEIIIPFLTLLLIMLFIATISFGYWTTSLVEEQTWKGLVDLSASLSRDFEEEEDKLLLLATTTAGNDALQAAITRKDSGALQQVLLPLKASGGLDFVKVVDKQGVTLLELRSNVLGDDNVNDKGAVSKAISGLFLADVIRSENKPILILSGEAPIKNPVGIIGGVIVGRVISGEFLADMSRGKGRHVISIVEQEKVFASTIEGGLESLPADLSGDAARFKMMINKQPYVGTAFPIVAHDEKTGLSMVVLTSVSYLAAVEQGLWLNLLLYFLAGAVLAGLIGYIVAKRISAPVVALSRVAERFSQGDTTARASVMGSNEVSVLGQSFNRMVAVLEDSNKKILTAYGDLDQNHQELVRTHQQLRVLLEASTSLTTTLKFQPLLDTIGRALLDLGDIDSVWILTVEHELSLVSGHALLSRPSHDGWLLPMMGAADEKERFSTSSGVGILSCCVKSGKPTFFSSTRQFLNENEKGTFGAHPNFPGLEASIAVVPFVAEDQVQALAVLGKCGEKGFSPEQQSSIRTFATTASLALRNARFFADVERLGEIDSLTQIKNTA